MFADELIALHDVCPDADITYIANLDQRGLPKTRLDASRIYGEMKSRGVMIEIIGAVRDAGFDVHLHIIGPVGDRFYYREIKKMQRKNSWIILEGLVDRQKLTSIISEHKYGIHGRSNEHFGIGVVEMIKG